jgi:hypothetical protein
MKKPGGSASGLLKKSEKRVVARIEQSEIRVPTATNLDAQALTTVPDLVLLNPGSRQPTEDHAGLHCASAQQTGALRAV